MSDAATSPNLAVYQLRVVMVGISPLIWRRLLIPADTTIAGLHTVLQTAFGWGGEHLHRFVIHGTEYGISYVGGSGFRDDARRSASVSLVCVSGSGSPTNTTTSPPGPATCASSRSPALSLVGPTHAASAIGAPARPRTAVGRGRSWSKLRPTWCSMRRCVPRRSWACSSTSGT
jgi:pRiA4b ORF-3-like protein